MRARWKADTDLPSSKRLGEAIDILRKSVLTVSDDKKSALITVSISGKSPQDAAEWANKISDQINEEFRLQAIRESSRTWRTTLPVGCDQYRRAATADSLVDRDRNQENHARPWSEEYVYRIVDRAEPPTRRDRPKKKDASSDTGLSGGPRGRHAAGSLFDPVRNLVSSVRVSPKALSYVSVSVPAGLTMPSLKSILRFHGYRCPINRSSCRC